MSGIFPDWMSFKAPATEIAEAGSQKIPSFSVNNFCVERISLSEKQSNQPFESLLSFNALSQLCGFPILIAVANVSGFLTLEPFINGAAPSA